MRKKQSEVKNRTKEALKNLRQRDITEWIGVAAILFFLLSLLPILYVGFYNYATGDDYWYSIHTYQGWLKEGFWGVIKGALHTVKEFYFTWQGTWFTIFLFGLSPNIFWENGYVIVVFLSSGFLIFSVSYLAYFYLVKKLGLSGLATSGMVSMVLYLMIQYIPRATSGIYWFNGIIHYSVPFFLGVVAVIHTHKFVDEKRWKDYLILFFCFTLLGGGSYLAPLAATLTVILILLSKVEIKRDKKEGKKFSISYDYKYLWVILALLAEVIGLAISFLSPGNQVRGGEEFSADLKWALQCVYYAIDRGIYLGEDYFLKNSITTVIYILLAVILWDQMKKRKNKKQKFPFPLLFVIYMNGVYWATYTPEIYSRSDVSGGVPNTYFHIFLLITFANMVYVHGWVQKKIEEGKYLNKLGDLSRGFMPKRKTGLAGKKLSSVCYIVAAVCVLGLIVYFLPEVKTLNSYCRDYIKSGELSQYLEIRKEQHDIFTTSLEDEVVVPEMEARYPLLNMTLDEYPGGWSNIDRAKYYNKKSVTAVKVK